MSSILKYSSALFGSLLPLALLTAPATQEIDITTGLPVRIAHAPVVAGPITSGGAEGVDVEVLWDLTHGVYIDYQPSGEYSQLVAMLAADGFHVSTTTAGVHNIDLSPYAVIVVCVGSAWDSYYRQREVNSLVQFVNGGGGLLVMGDNSSTPKTVVPVARAFGSVPNQPLLSPGDLYFTDFTSHPIFTGIDQLYFIAAGGVSAYPPSAIAAQTDFGEPVITVVPTARVVVLGDINGFDNSYMLADDAAFALNVFHFLAGS